MKIGMLMALCAFIFIFVLIYQLKRYEDRRNDIKKFDKKYRSTRNVPGRWYLKD